MTIPKGKRLTGPDRARAAKRLAKAYKGGASIRDIAEAEGRSYGWVHRVLTEQGITLRGRGGAYRKAAK